MEFIVNRGNRKFLHIKTEKTDEEGLIPLNKNALRLIKDESKLRVQGKMFNHYSEQKMNEYIKIIAKSAGIDKSKAEILSLGWGRHTFASLLIASGVDIVTVSKLLLHSNPKITLSYYAHLIPGQKEKAVAIFDRD